jgi:RNA-directed DNA polymerase
VEADRGGRIELFNLESVAVTRYRWRANTIPNPWTLPDHA